MPSLESVYRQELGYVLQTLRRLAVPQAALEDVAHDVFITVQAKLPGYDPTRPLKPWLFAISARSASNFHDRAHHRRESFEPADAEDPSLGPEGHSEAAAARRLVGRALQTLDADKRAIFVLHELDQVPVPEAAQALGVGADTAWSRLRAARKQFNEACLTMLAPAEVRTHG